MKNWKFYLHPMAIFIVAQLAWLSLVGMWIYWYTSNYIIFEKVGSKISPQIISRTANIIVLVIGLILLVAILAGMYLIFIYLNRQISLTKLYDNFISNVTHELKSPLASIQLYLETMKIRKIPAEKQQEFIDLMIADAERLQNLINSILKLSSLESRKSAYFYQIFDADSLIKSLIAESIEQLKIPLNSVLVKGAAPCKCAADSDALKIVFNILVDNANKYSRGKLQLTINYFCTSKNIVIEFIDEGIGISHENQKKIFKKFQRIYHPNTPNVKGTGLGLYLAREILRHHGGKISVFSEGENKGATFQLQLPIFPKSKKRYLQNLLKISKTNNDLEI
ncbi:MAG: HAMP domain-containing histidine kinase [Calditrichaeota bacterium]|nr:HAMP domain-containing histidine kinase [Calditrichota bacterium]